MTIQQLLPPRTEDPRTDPPAPAEVPRGFRDCRGEWHDLAVDGDTDAAS